MFSHVTIGSSDPETAATFYDAVLGTLGIAQLFKFEGVVAYGEKLAKRIRGVLARKRNITEKNMFGGVCFLLKGNMLCGIVGDELMVRVGRDAYEDALTQPYAREMDFTRKPMKGYVYVAPWGISTQPKLARWVERGLEFVRTLPAK
jgi:TfoX/Sxy family transcriptional regulator of competence genes